MAGRVHSKEMETLFGKPVLDGLFPRDRANRFFEALYGDAQDGAYDISLEFVAVDPERKTLDFEFHLRVRPGKCLVCSLTYGLPKVFSRHPVIDVQGLVREIQGLVDGRFTCTDWTLGSTRTVSDGLHVVPLTITYSE